SYLVSLTLPATTGPFALSLHDALPIWARQLASLASRTGRPSACSRSRPKGRPFNQVELALRITPLTGEIDPGVATPTGPEAPVSDRKSTRLNSSHVKISYAVFCLKKKK